jgi:hypothetical protein
MVRSIHGWRIGGNIMIEISNLDDFNKLAYKYGADMCPQIFHFYTEFYYKLLKDKREEVRKVLEIGVGTKEIMAHCPNYIEGAALYVWRDFFPNAQIYGIDILPHLVFKKHRIETFLCDQTDKKGLEDLIKKIGSDIDLVIDDGSHIPEHQVFTCKTLMPILNKSVEYIIEDVVEPRIIDKLPEYERQVIRHNKPRMKGRYDRLVWVRNKI